MSKKDKNDEQKKDISEREVKQLLEKVREFQELNQKYLIKSSTPRSEGLPPMIINMANTGI